MLIGLAYVVISITLAFLVHRARRDIPFSFLFSRMRSSSPTAPGGRITLCCEAQGRSAAIRVSDTGRGIPPDKLEDIFAPFVQLGRNLNNPAHGTGLGLAISRELARAMGGDLTVETAVGAGSTFTLTLPQRALSPEAAAA